MHKADVNIGPLKFVQKRTQSACLKANLKELIQVKPKTEYTSVNYQEMHSNLS